jgi:hypothetical protein
MRTRQIIISVLAAACFAGCSKHSSPQPEAVRRQKAAEIASYLTTNSLDVLLARYQQDEKQIQEGQTKLVALRRKYGITDKSPTQLDQINQNGKVVVTSQQPYWDAKRKLVELVSFQRQLQTQIQADKIDAQIPSQGTH